MTYPPPGQGHPDASGHHGGQPGPYEPSPYGAGPQGPGSYGPGPYEQQPPSYEQQPPYPQQQPPQPQQPGQYPQAPAQHQQPSPYPQHPGSYPQQQPAAHYQGPASGMPADPYQQPGHSHPGYPPQQPPYGHPGFPPPQPSSNSNGPLIAILALVGVLLVGGAAAVLYLALGGNAEPRAAAPPSGSPSPSESPSPSPSPTPSPTETEDSEPVSADEYDEDWDFRLGDVKLSATHVKGWDYEDCTKFERGGTLTEAGCDYGVEVTYKAESGKLKVSNLILVMSDQDASEQLNKDLAEEDFQFHQKSYIKDFSYGKWKRKFNGRYFVITICTATKSVDEDKAGEYLHYMNADMTAAFSFR